MYRIWAVMFGIGLIMPGIGPTMNGIGPKYLALFQTSIFFVRNRPSFYTGIRIHGILLIFLISWFSSTKSNPANVIPGPGDYLDWIMVPDPKPMKSWSREPYSESG